MTNCRRLFFCAKIKKKGGGNMAYMYPYGNYYQPQQAQQPQYAMPTQTNNAINWVSGESGAKAWMVNRGETVLLMDSEAQVFYIKSADNSGMPLPLRVFDYTERTTNTPTAPQSAVNVQNDNYITRTEFDELRAKYEELEKQLKAKPKKKEADNE